MSVSKATSHASFGESVRFLMVLLVIGSLVYLASNMKSGQFFSFTSIERPVESTGSVNATNVGVYWDRNCSNAVSFIDWGEIEPGSVTNVSLFVRNEGKAAARLFLSTDNWSPSNASEFMTLRWDYDNQMLAPPDEDSSDILLVALTLQVSPSIRGIKSFSFDVIIGATA
jgi:hypothetical protein